MSSLSKKAVKFLTEDAERFVQQYGGEPKDPDNPADVEAVSFTGMLGAVIDSCSVPELASDAVRDFLETLPELKHDGDAFKGLHILIATYNKLADLVQADRYIQEASKMPGDDVKLPKPSNDPSLPNEKEIQRSAQQHDQIDENEITESAYDGATSDEIDRLVAKSAESSQMTPTAAFRKAIGMLLNGLIQKTRPHVQHMITSALIEVGSCREIAQKIMKYGSKLPPPGMGYDRSID